MCTHDTNQQGSPHALAASHKWSGRASLTMLLPLLLGAPSYGCATVAEAISTATASPQLQVQIDGLRFLTLGTQRLLAVTQMRSHGWECRDEAATELHVACTRPGASPIGNAVVLSFADETLDVVRMPVKVARGDLRTQFEELVEQGRQSFPQASVDRTDVVSVARFLPGDGSSVELRLFVGAEAMERIHFAPSRRPQDEPRHLRLTQR